MALFTPADRKFVEAVVRLAHTNPFLPERIACEQTALGAEFDSHLSDWNVRYEDEHDHPNLQRLLARGEATLEHARERLARHPDAHASEAPLYEDFLLAVLYHRHRFGFDELIATSGRQAVSQAGKLYRALAGDAERMLAPLAGRSTLAEQLPHLFAGFFQIRRAFGNIFRLILGVSRPAVRLRAQVWESIFTHDMRRYRRTLFARMADYTTLVTGPSGTGKELVAQAIGLSRYIPFDAAAGRFHEDFAGSFHAINLSALSATLIESELFGHKRGAFTGAIDDRQGWLEVCPPLGTVFLDEIGELDASIQVKLLRVLQSREFNRIGETQSREFRGKIIAATNRDLAAEMRAGRFREDFYYRLCSDMIEVPALWARVQDNPAELRHLIAHLAQRAIGPDGEALADEVMRWIEEHLGLDYAWPGNIRELEQCLRNVLIRRSYVPPATAPAAAPVTARDELVTAMLGGQLTADDLLRRYCALVFAETGSYEATARRLKLDRRTVRAKIDAALVARLQAG
ncbi:MAG: sigma 54-interacting transcriptional regulator [Pirellulales bacterium]|nr:sigma 54-interacting transcriptional regulator [Pirellulales bacterium]